MKTDVLVIGGGPAGLAAALAASKEGAKVLIAERDSLGGILNQCIHAGFGLKYFGEELTGPEYAARFVNLALNDENISTIKGSVVRVSEDRIVGIASETGYVTVEAGAIVIATGCRERPAGTLNIAGSHPAGIFTAGTAQRLINIDGLSVGKKIVILGSGDIGLIMARRFTLEGAKVEAVLEAMPNPGGLNRNISQCLKDFGIPLYLSKTVVEVLGDKRVTGVITAEVDANLKPVAGTDEKIECDTLILSVGLIPENDLFEFLHLDRATKGPFVDSLGRCEQEGFFACGNALHVHDLVDNVTNESETTGKSAALYALNKLKGSGTVSVNPGKNVASIVPQRIVKDAPSTLYIRARNKVRNAEIKVTDNKGREIAKMKRLAFAPNETIVLDVPAVNNAASVTVSLEGEV